MPAQTTGKQINEIQEMLTAFIQSGPQHLCQKEAELSEITDRIAEVHQTQAVIMEQLKSIIDTNKKVIETIYGNGKPGLTTIVSESKRDIDAILAVAKAALFTMLGLGITAVFYLVLSHGIIP